MTPLIARCPHCDTAFRVVPDQLRVRDGKVRCGVCHRIFDARAALADAGIALDEPTLPLSQSARTAGVDLSDDDRREPAIGTPPASPPWVDDSREPRIGAAPTHAEPRYPPVREPRRRVAPPAPPARPARIRADGAPPPAPRVWPVAGPAARDAADDDNEHGDFGDPEPHDPYRFSASRPDAPLPPSLAGNGNGGVGRLLSGLGFWLALLALLLQAVYWWRTPLATHIPALRAPLETVCASFGCEVGYVRAPQRLAITSSAVQPDVLGGSVDSQRLQLQAVLRNRASHPQPWPMLEVTLTDHADQVVARRAVPPAVYLPAGEQRRPFEAGAERDIHLSLVARGAPVTGYRLALYFP